ncbi:hypothetical protein GCU67_02580 [Modestobacter muralis]|uniref:RNA polymerase sigma factor 70 region 4 type 2 domain-containing protein n=1 Tax=Modestobacter muralis TaxID=1608614 RepID=A0A6P0H273_9ACTN|nr:hypothetical protein [Modestobacter muralis]NEK93063.1 hypothetical protein [Modestobacter muralis]NEN49830.1 hypothetical protein [Modestobacter muralis]
MDRRTDDFAAFVADCEPQLRGTALLLTGDPEQADDLVVTALARTHRRWRRLGSPADALADTRGALVEGALGRTEPSVAGGSIGTLPGPDDDRTDGGRLDPGDRRWLAALAALGPTARVVVVLRLVEGLDEESVATLLDRSPQTVADVLDAAVERLGDLLEPEPTPVAAPTATDTWTAAPPATGEADAVFRRPGTPEAPARPDPAPAVAPAGPAPADDGSDPADDSSDPWAIYRRPS